MVLNTETIEVLYMRNGLGRFHLSAAPLQCEYDHCIHDFARAIEAEVREQDDALIRQMLGALEAMRSEAAARHCGLRICDEAITAARARLEDKP